ncbi:hypothetical protein ACUOA5_26200 [Escherichia coli]
MHNRAAVASLIVLVLIGSLR